MKDRLNKLSVVISNFSSLEIRLAEFLDFLPYTKDSKHVVSPRFIPIILDACSLIDSVLRHLAVKSDKRIGFKELALETESHLELDATYSILLTPTIEFLNPFASWTTKTPAWWAAYNRVKHDRVSEYSNATYENVVLSLCALHQVLARNGHFIPSLISAGWLDHKNPDLEELIMAQHIHVGVKTLHLIPVETRLFVTPNISNFVDFSGGQPRVSEDCCFSPRILGILSADECVNAGEFE